ncbi:MAG: hypothetical protein IPP22_16185 [Nitrosomonas sp.]|nr:hypothetical protein [Nitrosomonas sp.]
MVDPLLWNTLNEAADWLSNETGTKWNRKRVIDFSIQQYRDRNKEKKMIIFIASKMANAFVKLKRSFLQKRVWPLRFFHQAQLT